MSDNIKTNVMRILDKEKIKYIPHEYSHDEGAVDGITVALRLGIEPEKIFKTLVTRGASKEIYVFDIPVIKELDLKKAAKAVGEKSVEMIHVDEINKITGYIRGGCSPIGMKKQYKTVLDSLAQNQNEIVVSAGKIGFQVELSPESLKKLIGASFCDVTVSNRE
ncbi:MAG: Cys-tRNA(Pro) deacylase YbaK [Clostridia bacterium]|jgi:Cys-tRNA(Pro)/Cys-tRNA(Cys) deacylase|nr:Cys-tRNA(Pro) deacylase YbaK [Clostridia bacterium]